MDFLLLIGSTREGRKTAHAAEYLETKLQEREHNTEIFDLKQRKIPFLNNRTYADEEQAPENARILSQKVKQTDCLVIITPEYNHSIPGVLKNALDHLYPEYSDKDFAYITTSDGGFGGIRALKHLHDITLAVEGNPGPNLPISNIAEVFSKEGDLKDGKYISRFDSFIDELEKLQ